MGVFGEARVLTGAWRPPALILASMALHGAALGSVAALPQAWPWALGAVLANHLLLTALTLFPNGQLLGRSLCRLPPQQAGGHVALTFDDGPDPEVTPLLLALLERYDARATFFCIGERAARYPELVQEIVARGHTIGNHTMHHPGWFALLGPGGQRREWQDAENVLQRLGVESRLARAPLGLRSPISDLALHRCRLRHVGWSQRGFDTRCGDPALVLARITRRLREGDIILLHDANAELDAHGVPVCLSVLERLLPLLASRALSSIRLEG